MWKIVGFTVLGVGVAVGGVFYNHYGDAYSAVLRPPSESWHTYAPSEYQELATEGNETVRHAVSFVREPGTLAAVLTETDPLFGGTTDMKTEVEEARSELEARAEVKHVYDCKGVSKLGQRWHCLEWTLAVDGSPLRGRQRVYITRRGSSVVAVTFAAVPEDRFGRFGNPARWLEDLEWRGPGVAYAF